MSGLCYKRRAEKPKMAEPNIDFGSAKGKGGSPANPHEGAGELDAEPALAMNYCPRCSTRLAARSCKLICPDCRYYMSCSDFY
jgi:hypothetical protein